MIPVRDEEPFRRFPWMSLALIAANVAVFATQVRADEATGSALIARFALVPGGMLASPASVATLITSAFLHAGWAHLLGNMLYLWVFGPGLEGRLGSWRLLVLYLSCAIAAGMVHVASTPTSTVPLVGASGAISGLLGATLLVRPGARVRALVVAVVVPVGVVSVPAMFLIGVWLLVQLASGLAPVAPGAVGGVAWFAHIGGFSAGAIAGVILRVREARGPARFRGWD